MFLDGFIISENNKDVLKVERILCDSGALHGSYIAKEFLDSIRPQLSPRQIKKVNSNVRLGDNLTVVPITEVVLLDLVVTSADLIPDIVDKEFTVQELFCVIPTGPNIIIGLPTIVHFIPDLFKIMVDRAVDVYRENSENDDVLQDNNNIINSLCEIFNIS